MSGNNIHRVGVDWGSTGFRAYLFNEDARLIETRSSHHGIKTVKPDHFEQTLFELIGDWLTEDSLVLLSGMITSRAGWVETPYLPLPTQLDRLLTQSISRRVRNVNLFFLPGLCQTQPRADVIRGEELQLFGATENIEQAMVIMPGTHSKWAYLSHGTVHAFQTIVTGELFDVLLNNTLVGQLATDKSLNRDVFSTAAITGYNSTNIVSEFFHARSGVLLEQLDAAHVHSYLSGLLIGNEIREGFALAHNESSDSLNTLLIGSDELCARYELAFKAVNMQCARSDTQTTANAFANLLLMHSAM